MSIKYEGGVGLGQGSNPVAPSGNIHVNAMLHMKAIRKMQLDLARRKTALNGSPDIAHWDINHGDVVVTLESNAGYPDPITGLAPNDTERARHANHQDISLYVTGCLNGFGDAGDDRYLLTQKIRSAAVATGRVKAIDANPAVAVRVGGMASIINTGPSFIAEGDIVEVSAPDPNDPRKISYSRHIPAGKIVPWTVPSDEMSIASLLAAYKMLRTNGKPTREDRASFPFAARFAEKLYEFTLRTAQTSILAAVKLGLVEITAGRGLPEPRFDDGDLRSIPGFLDLMSRQEVQQYFFKSLVVKETDYHLFRKTATTAVTAEPKYAEPWMAKVMDDQLNAFTEYQAATAEMELKRKRLVLGRATRNAVPGDTIDLLLGPL